MYNYILYIYIDLFFSVSGNGVLGCYFKMATATTYNRENM